MLRSKYFYIAIGCVLLLLVFIFAIYTKDFHDEKDEKAISDFLNAVGYRDADFNTKHILENPAIVTYVEEMTELDLSNVKVVQIHAESSLDDNLSMKCSIHLSEVENFLEQFLKLNKKSIFKLEFDKKITPFGDKNINWWNPVQTTLSKSIILDRFKSSMKILVTPVDDKKAEIYIFWFEL